MDYIKTNKIVNQYLNNKINLSIRAHNFATKYPQLIDKTIYRFSFELFYFDHNKSYSHGFWNLIQQKKALSYQFLDRYKDKINWIYIDQNSLIPRYIKKKFPQINNIKNINKSYKYNTNYSPSCVYEDDI